MVLLSVCGESLPEFLNFSPRTNTKYIACAKLYVVASIKIFDPFQIFPFALLERNYFSQIAFLCLIPVLAPVPRTDLMEIQSSRFFPEKEKKSVRGGDLEAGNFPHAVLKFQQLF